MLNWMIYGATGYSGEHIAREAVQRGMRPVLAGRDASKVSKLAAELGLEGQAFDLQNPMHVAGHLQSMHLVLNCAGPFSATAAPMMEAALVSGTHYLDITGEIEVFEQASGLHDRARAAGVVLCCGVGMDVMPTDGIAMKLKSALPDAHLLSLGFASKTAPSPGTAKTAVEGLVQGGRIRRKGQLIRVPLGHHTRKIDFGDGMGERPAMTIPWGDVSTAYHSTGIPNIAVYVPAIPSRAALARMSAHLRPLLGLQAVQNLLKKQVEQTIKTGPSQEVRERTPTFVWGEARNRKGEVYTARLKTLNGYTLTTEGSLFVVQHLLDQRPDGGFYTPSLLLQDTLLAFLQGWGPMDVQGPSGSSGSGMHAP